MRAPSGEWLDGFTVRQRRASFTPAGRPPATGRRSSDGPTLPLAMQQLARRLMAELLETPPPRTTAYHAWRRLRRAHSAFLQWDQSAPCDAVVLYRAEVARRAAR